MQFERFENSEFNMESYGTTVEWAMHSMGTGFPSYLFYHNFKEYKINGYKHKIYRRNRTTKIDKTTRNIAN